MKIPHVILSFLIIFSGVSVFAQGQEVGLPSAGLKPGSPFYFLDRLGEALQEFLTFSPESKARLQITFAAERIAEIKVIIESKEIDAKGLDTAQSRLQTSIAKAGAIVNEQKAKGENVSALATNLTNTLDVSKLSLDQTFKEQKRELKIKESELKNQIRAARQAGDTAKVEELVQELGKVKAQLELLDLKEEDIEDDLDEEEEKLEEELEAKSKAEKAIREAEREKEEVLDEAVEEGIELLPNAFNNFDNLLAQAKSAFEAGNFLEARRLAKQAKEIAEQIEEQIEELEEQRELKEEAQEAIDEAEDELAEAQSEAKKEGVEIPAQEIGKVNSLISQAKTALAAGNFQEAIRLAKQADRAAEDLEKVVKKLEKQMKEDKKKEEKQSKEERKLEEKKAKEEKKTLKEEKKNEEKLNKEKQKENKENED